MVEFRRRAWKGFVRAALLIAPAPLLGGCFGHLSSSQATMNKIDAPVLLGPVDHVGGGKPLAVERTGDFEATAKHVVSHSESNGYSVDTDIKESEMNEQAEYATRGDAYKDIRLTEVKPQAVGVLVSAKSRVDVRGDVVRVKKGGAQ